MKTFIAGIGLMLGGLSVNCAQLVFSMFALKDYNHDLFTGALIVFGIGTLCAMFARTEDNSRTLNKRETLTVKPMTILDELGL